MASPELMLLTNLLFAEAAKDSKHIEKDATAVAWVIKNRLSRPERFGSSLQEVIYAPYQFTGVNSPEWQKAVNRQFTPEEENVYKKMMSIASGVLRGDIKDPTGGADHYLNPKLLKKLPNWAKVYSKTYSSGVQDYYKEK